jgi:hypothetical protein
LAGEDQIRARRDHTGEGAELAGQGPLPCAAITEPREVANLLKAIHGYSGHPYAAAALKLAPLVFTQFVTIRAY